MSTDNTAFALGALHAAREKLIAARLDCQLASTRLVGNRGKSATGLVDEITIVIAFTDRLIRDVKVDIETQDPPRSSDDELGIAATTTARYLAAYLDMPWGEE